MPSHKEITEFKRNEASRLIFIEDTQGSKSTYEFACRGIIEYRRLLFTAAGRGFRVPLICSYIMFKKFVTQYKTDEKAKEIIKSIASSYRKRTDNVNFLGNVEAELLSALPELIQYLKL